MFVCMYVCIDTMGASTAGGIPAKLGGDAPLQRAGIRGYGFGGSGSGVYPWAPKCSWASPVRPREKFAKSKL